MKETLTHSIIVLILASCDSDKQNISDEMGPFTGESIQPIVNSLGETIITGVPVPAMGKAIHLLMFIIL